jgi:hypothetical protein
LPLLVTVRTLAQRLLSGLLPLPPPDTPTTEGLLTTSPISGQPDSQFHIGFITPPFKDSKIPVTDHLHAHAYIAPADLLGWFRAIGYGPLAWYAVDDLIAEIRFESALVGLLWQLTFLPLSLPSSENPCRTTVSSLGTQIVLVRQSTGFQVPVPERATQTGLKLRNLAWAILI